MDSSDVWEEMEVTAQTRTRFWEYLAAQIASNCGKTKTRCWVG